MATERSSLFVEGKDDFHALYHLLKVRGVDTDVAWFPEIKEAGGVDELLKIVEIAVKVGDDHAVGFVLDANASPDDRWRAVSNRLASVGLTPPADLSAGGYVGFCESWETRVGVWLMPDNQRQGALEDFLIDLVDPADPLLSHARDATARARELGATFPDTALRKAELRAWLAWREEPGLPYGSALTAGYFRHDSPDAETFATWFDRLFREVVHD